MRCQEAVHVFFTPARRCSYLHKASQSNSSSSTVMTTGCKLVTIDYLFQLNLGKSDVFPRDRQNYRSCQKLRVSLEYLQQSDDSRTTVVCLHIICSVMIAFIKTSPITIDRIYHAWVSVFICRLRCSWIDPVPQHELNKVFEINKNKLILTVLEN